jgi:ACR3 family arsenite transporter
VGLFEKYLSLWVALAIGAGVALGTAAPGLIQHVAKLEFASVNLVVAALIWVMIYPMMLKVVPRSIAKVGQRPKGLILTLVINWLIKPFTMAALAILFFKYIFASFISAEDASHYIAGLILLGVAPCTAMVFVWSNLTRGDAAYTLVQVTVNDLILIFAFAPIAGLLLGVTDLFVPWDTLVLSVGIFVALPLLAGMITRYFTLKRGKGEEAVDAIASKLKPFSILGLLLTVVLLFSFQAETLLDKPLRVAMIATPLLIQGYGIFFIAYFAAKLMRLEHKVAAPAAMIGTSNFFELAVAVAISLFGLTSGAALATVVGVLIEVPVMLSLVKFANKTRHWFPEPEVARPPATPEQT